MSQENEVGSNATASKDAAVLKIEDVSFQELKDFTIKEMSDQEKEMLKREQNEAALDEILRTHLKNSMLVGSDVALIIVNILKRFNEEALSGDVIKYIYVGSRDAYKNSQQNAMYHNCLMLRLNEDGSVYEGKNIEGLQTPFDKFNVFDPTPNNRVSDTWAPGYIYDTKVKEKDSGKTDNDGKKIIYYNLTDYRSSGEGFDILRAVLLNNRAIHESLEKQVKNGIVEEVAGIIKPQMQYRTGIAEFTVTNVKGLTVGHRELKGESWEWTFADDAPMSPALVANGQEQHQIVLNLHGEVKVGEPPKEGEDDKRFKFTYYVNFRAQDLGQYFVHSPTLKALFENKAFLSESPENQLDFIAIKLRGKKFRTIGDMMNVDFSKEGDQGYITMNGVALVEVVD